MVRVLSIFILLFLSSCSQNTHNCVKGMIEDSYSYEEATEGCDDAQLESQLQN